MTAKEEISLFLDKPEVKKIDKLVKDGMGTNRSEVIRRIVIEYFLMSKRLKDHEKRIGSLEGAVDDVIGKLIEHGVK